MATGGYKSVKFSWQGGRMDSALDRTKYIINGICDAITGASAGWVLDTLTPTSSDFLTMPSADSSTSPNLLKVLKLEYDSHTYRLGIGLVYNGYGNSGYPMKAADCTTTMTGSDSNFGQTGLFSSGLYVGMIKDGTLVSDNTYGYVWDGNGEFLRWSPFSLAPQGSTNYSFAGENGSGYLYAYYAVLKNAQIAIFANSSNWTDTSTWTSSGAKLKGIVLGEVFKETGHTSDEYKLASFYLHSGGQTTTGECSYYPADSDYYYGINMTTGYYSLDVGYKTGVSNQVFKADGSILSGMVTTGSSTSRPVTWGVCLNYDTLTVSNSVSGITTSPGGRWTPCYLWVYAADHATYGVVSGDGFKGYLDTDLIRGVNPNYSYGQQLNGGDFVYLGGGFAIGWDSNNTTLLF